MESQGSLFDADREQDLDPSLPGAEFEIYQHAIGARLADRAFDSLSNEIEWQQDHIRMMGKLIPLPRLTAWFGDPGRDYSYSGIAMSAQPWTSVLIEIKKTVEQLAGQEFNSVLCNLYRDGSDGLAWHSDDEPELGEEPVIASVSLGATRRFLLRRRDDHDLKCDIPLAHGDLLVMRGTTQALCEHSVPKTKKPVGPRVNLTFRTISLR